MFKFASLSVLALALSSVSGLVIPRVPSPDASNWSSSLEDYATYHGRYLSYGCQNKHSDVQFFDKCCHPLTAGSQPDASCGSSSTSPASESDDGDDGDCDDSDDTDDSDNTDNSDNSSPTSDVAKVANVDVSAKTSASSSTSGYNTGGFATFFYQGGNAGACGTVHSDSDLVAAMDVDLYGDTGRKSSLCGRRVQITNTNNGKSVTVVVADACPTCKNSNSIDLSVGAFNKIATEEQGMVPIKWKYV